MRAGRVPFCTAMNDSAVDFQSVDAAERDAGAGLQPHERASGECDGGDAAQVVGDVQRRLVGRQRGLLRRRELAGWVDSLELQCVGSEMEYSAGLAVRDVDVAGAADRHVAEQPAHR